MIQHFTKNTVGRDFVVGDIHGCFALLEVELNNVNFDVCQDRIFCVGDLIDRGDSSHEVLDWLRLPYFFSVRGNHEDMLIGVNTGMYSSYGYIQNGGSWFFNLDEETQGVYAEELSLLPYAIEVETDNGLIGIIHADCPVPDWDNLEKALKKPENRKIALWNRARLYNGIDSKVDNIFTIYVGHTPVAEPFVSANIVYIDTGAVFGKRLTVIQL